MTSVRMGDRQPPACGHESAAVHSADGLQALSDSEARHLALMDAALDAIVTIGSDDRILEFNAAAERLFGHARSEVLGREMAEILIPRRLRRAHRDGMSRHSGTGGSTVLGRRAEFEALRRDGSEFPIELTVTQLSGLSPPRFTAFIRDITERRALEAAQRARVGRFTRQRDALLALAMAPRLDTDDPLDAFRRITEVAAHTLGVARVSVWRYTPDRAAIRCVNLYDRRSGAHSSGMELTAEGHPAYFAALSRTEIIAADDAHVDASTFEFSADYLQPLGIGSMLDAPIHLRGQADGVLCHEHVGPPRHWEEDEKSFVLTLANLVSLALEACDRRRAEAALRRSEGLLRIASRTALLGGWTLELADGTLSRSDELCRVLDVPSGSVVSLEHVIGLYAAPWREAVGDAFRRCVADGTPFDLEGEFFTAAGRRLWVREIAHAERDEAGNIIRLHGALQDITDRKNAEAERARLAAQLGQSQKMESLGTLAGGIAHDFNNILGAILGNLVLARAELPDGHAANGSLQQIERAGLRARDLVRQILAFSRQQPQVLVNQPLQPLVEQALALLRVTVPAGVQLDASLDEVPLFVRADSTQIQQVVINLCTNAWHALGAGGGRVGVNLDAVTLDEPAPRQPGGVAAGRYARLSVSDTGHGMDEATRARVFEPFFTTKPVGEGTGLGLSVVHGIVTSCAGTIAVESAPGRGTCFRVFLPLQPEARCDAGVPAARVKPAAAAGRHVLYLDDDEVMLLTIERLLRRAGYRVTVCADGRSALTAVRQSPATFDAVVTDFNMPGLSGLDVVEELLRLRTDLPVVITSGYISDTLRVEATRLGVRRVIGKERLHDALVAALQDVLPAAPTPRAALHLPTTGRQPSSATG